MGFHARWLAIKNADLPSVLQTIGLRRESEVHEAVFDPGSYAVTMPGGWLVVIGDGWDAMAALDEPQALALSRGTEVFFFHTDDTSMCASLTAFRDGKEAWSLVHVGSNGPGTPEITGAAPDIVREIIARLQKEQHDSKRKDVDTLYDAAPEIGLALTGFRHDQTLGDGEVLPVLVLAPAH